MESRTLPGEPLWNDAVNKQILRLELPLPPSVNHYYFTTLQGKRIMTGDAKAWMEEAKLIIRLAARKYGWNIIDTGKVIMRLWVYWPDNRRRDQHNLHKALADAPEGIIFADDRQLLIHDMDFAVDKGKPRVVIEFEPRVEVEIRGMG